MFNRLAKSWGAGQSYRVVTAAFTFLGFFSLSTFSSSGFASTNPEAQAFAQNATKSSQNPPESALAAKVRALNNSLLGLHGQLQQGTAGSSADTVRGQAATVIAERAAALKSLIEENPRAALSFAFSSELLADLAAKFPASTSLLESNLTVTGRPQHWVEDSADLKTSRSYFRLDTGAQTLNLHFAGAEPTLGSSGELLRATGVVVGSEMAVLNAANVTVGGSIVTPTMLGGFGMTLEGNLRREIPAYLALVTAIMLFAALVLGDIRELRDRMRAALKQFAMCVAVLGMVVCNPMISDAQSVCSTTGVQNVAVLLVNFQDVAIVATSQQANNAFFDTTTGHSLDGYWQEASYGQTSATGNILGPYTIGPSTSYSCLNLTQIFDDAVAAASASGVNLQNYTRINIVFPGLNCGWAGVTVTGSAGAGCNTWSTPAGTLTASVSYILPGYFSTRDQAVSLVAHENGHQLGLGHSGTINDEPTAVLGPLAATGNIGDFNDFFSVMGNWTLGLYAAEQKAEILNWLPSGSSYQVVQSSGTYVLQPIETSPPGLQALKVERGTGNNAWLWIEYRQPLGSYDSTIGFMNFNGALIHYEDSSTGNHTHVLDFTPSDVGSWYNTVLAPGQTWADPYSNASISVISATSAGLTVSVSYGPAPCGSSAPGVNVSPLDPSIYPGQSASYSVSVTNNDSSACASSTISLGSTEPSGWTTSLSSSSLTLSPGQSTTVTMSKGAPTGTPAGTYAVNLNASTSSSSVSDTANATVMTPPALGVSASVSGSTFVPPGTVSIAASVTSGGTPASGASVAFTLTAPNGNMTTQSATTGTNGVATWNYKLNAKSPAGTYSVSAQAALSSGSGGKKTSTSASTETATSNTVSFSVQ
jgi:M6 family metalloprotease-like protein